MTTIDCLQSRDSDDMQNSGGGQEVKSSYGRNRGESVEVSQTQNVCT